MPFQPAPGVIGVTIEGRLFGQQYINDLYFFQNGADPTVGDCSTVATIVKDWFIAEVLPQVTETLIMLKVTAKNLAVNGGAKAVIGFGGAQGEVLTEQAPNNCCAVVTFDTGQSGKSSHGRNYISGVPNAVIDVNTIASDWYADLIDGYMTLLPGGAFDPSPYFWSVLSRQSAGIILGSAIAVPVLNVYASDTTVDSQRRRLPGRGR